MVRPEVPNHKKACRRTSPRDTILPQTQVQQPARSARRVRRNIGLGGALATLALTDSTLGFGLGRLAAGVAFSLGLLCW